MTATESPFDLVVVSELRRATRSGAARHLRELARISQAQLARTLGVAPAAVNRWEQGHRQPSERLARPYVEMLCRFALSLRESDDPAVEDFRRVAELLAQLGYDVNATAAPKEVTRGAAV